MSRFKPILLWLLRVSTDTVNSELESLLYFRICIQITDHNKHISFKITHYIIVITIIWYCYLFIFIRLNARKRSPKKWCCRSRRRVTEQLTWWWVCWRFLIGFLLSSYHVFLTRRLSVRKHSPKRWCSLRTQLVRGRQCSGDYTGCMVSLTMPRSLGDASMPWTYASQKPASWLIRHILIGWSKQKQSSLTNHVGCLKSQGFCTNVRLIKLDRLVKLSQLKNLSKLMSFPVTNNKNWLKN